MTVWRPPEDDHARREWDQGQDAGDQDPTQSEATWSLEVLRRARSLVLERPALWWGLSALFLPAALLSKAWSDGTLGTAFVPLWPSCPSCALTTSFGLLIAAQIAGIFGLAMVLLGIGHTAWGRYPSGGSLLAGVTDRFGRLVGVALWLLPITVLPYFASQALRGDSGCGVFRGALPSAMALDGILYALAAAATLFVLLTPVAPGESVRRAWAAMQLHFGAWLAIGFLAQAVPGALPCLVPGSPMAAAAQWASPWITWLMAPIIAALCVSAFAATPDLAAEVDVEAGPRGDDPTALGG